MTKTWAKELGRKGFTVNAVAPGFISTKMTQAMPEEVLASMVDKVSVKRMGTVQDIANACMFLSSDEASYVNGTVMSVDGGLTI
jgi:3-oxoacyl-[acyl-carrier protein] reductase